MDWNAVLAGLGLLVSGVTLWFVLLDRAERGRRMRRVAWDFRAINNRYEVVGEEHNLVATTFRLSNIGASLGNIVSAMIVGAELIDEDNPLPHRVFLAGAHHDFRVKPVDSAEVWLWILYMDAEDERFLHAKWFPLAGQEGLELEHSRQMDDRRQRRNGRKLASRSQAGVGPGGVYYRAWRRTGRDYPTAVEASAQIALDAGGLSILN